MDPSELRMNLASLQRIDPYIKEILMSSPQVALYKYEGTEWEKTNIEGTLFVYARKCEPTYGFLILNRLSTTNLIQPVTPDIELQDKTPFLLYKTKDILGIWFYEQSNCKKLFTTITDIITTLKSGRPAAQNDPGYVNLADMLNNAGSKEGKLAKPSQLSGGEKLLRLLSNQNQQEVEKKNDDSVAAFFAQVSSSQSINPPPPGIMMSQQQINQPPMTALQNLLSSSGVMSVDSLESPHKMPPLPPQAKAASDLESDYKPRSSKKATNAKEHVKATPGKAKKNDNKVNGSYASVLAQQPAVPTSVAKTAANVQEQPELLSPMVFAASQQSMEVSLQPHPVFPNLGGVMSSPLNGGMPVQRQIPAITPLTEDQLLQAFRHLLNTDRSLITKLHQAYVESLNTKLQ